MATYRCPNCGTKHELSIPEIQEIGDPFCPDCIIDRDTEVEMELVDEVKT